jgi:hypothetical protein
VRVSKLLLAWSIVLSAVMVAEAARADEPNSSIASCLRTWGEHPFGSNPTYTTMATSVMVFGIGKQSADTQRTQTPALVLVNPGVNVMGGTTIDLLNPNGWYCFRSKVNVMGNLRIRADCQAHLASAQDGVAVLGADQNNKSVTVLGNTHIELVGCK